MQKFLVLIVLSCLVGNAFGFAPSPSARLAKRSRHDVHAIAEHIDSFHAIGQSLHHAQDFMNANAHQFHNDVSSHLGSLPLSVADGDIIASAPEVASNGNFKVDKTGPIGFLATYIEEAITGIHNILGGEQTYGYSIILFTLLIKGLTLPLTKTQLESTTRMQKLTPLQERIKAQFPNKEDEQTRNQLLSQLFQAANVNPLAGCFPAIAQIPIFISLYRSLQNLIAENKLDEPFLWIPDLQGPVYNAPPGQTFEWIKTLFSGEPLLGMHDSLLFLTLPLILFISQTISMKILQPPVDPNKVLTEQEQVTKGLTQNLPFIVAFFSVNVPAGLALYWIVNNAMTTVITATVKNSLKDEPVPAEVDRMMAQIEAGPPGSSRSRATGGGVRGGGDKSASKRALEAAQMSTKGGGKSFSPSSSPSSSSSSSRPSSSPSSSTSSSSVIDVEATVSESTSTGESSVSGGNDTPASVSVSNSVEDKGKDDSAPKGPLGKALKFVNEKATEAAEKAEADAKAEELSFNNAASMSNIASGEGNSNANVAPVYREGGGSKRKKRTKPAQKKKGGKK